MQTTFASSRILLPVRHWFILVSLLVALLLNFLPTSAWLFVPDWVAMLVIFWSIREPRRVCMGTGFILGLAMDVADASMLGQHALAYVFASYAASSLSRRILWFPLGQQALHVLPLLLMVQFVQLAIRVMHGGDFPGWVYFVGPFIGTLLWLPLTFVLLLPQYQPVDRDSNRPI
jgi:rod shape-determining protein MreD